MRNILAQLLLQMGTGSKIATAVLVIIYIRATLFCVIAQ
jgi:hypothetical protein